MSLAILDPTETLVIINPLTERELQCLIRSAEGLTAASIGYQLGIASRTVKHHQESARKKLGAASTTHAVATAIRWGLIP